MATNSSDKTLEAKKLPYICSLAKPQRNKRRHIIHEEEMVVIERVKAVFKTNQSRPSELKEWTIFEVNVMV